MAQMLKTKYRYGVGILIRIILSMVCILMPEWMDLILHHSNAEGRLSHSSRGRIICGDLAEGA